MAMGQTQYFIRNILANTFVCLSSTKLFSKIIKAVTFWSVMDGIPIAAIPLKGFIL